MKLALLLPCNNGSPNPPRTRLGHLVVGVVDQALLLHDCVLRLQPDVVIVGTESPGRDTLEKG